MKTEYTVVHVGVEMQKILNPTFELSGLFDKCAGHNNALGILFNSNNLENIKKYF